MAQSEAGKSVQTVPNDEAEEEFGPQLITKLEVCIYILHVMNLEFLYVQLVAREFFHTSTNLTTIFFSLSNTHVLG